MAFTRKFLEALGLNETQVQAVVDEHTATTDAIRQAWEQKFNAAKAEADKIPDLTAQLKDQATGKTYEELYAAEHAAFDQYRTQVEGEKARAAKAAAVRAYYTEKKITGANQAVAMRGTDLSQIELGEDGKIKDTKPLDDLVAGDFKMLVDTGKRVVDTGAHVGDNNGGGQPTYSLRAAIREGYSRQQ